MSRSRSGWLPQLVLIFVSVSIGAVFCLPKDTQAATVTWDGGGADGTCGGAAGDGNKWSCGANWSTDSVPTSADVATFNSTSTKNVTIDSAQTVAGITITTGYTGTVTQSADLTVNGSFTHDSTNGTFTWSSGTLTLGSTNTTWNVDTGDDTFGNVTIDNTNNVTVTSGDTAIVTGTLTLTNGNIVTGTVEARGDVVHGAGFDGGSGTLTITQGSSDINLTAGGQLPNVTLSASRTINANASGTVTFDNAFTMSAGTFAGSTGTIDITGNVTISGTATFTAPTTTMYVAGSWTHTDTASSTFNHNSSTIEFDGSSGTLDVNSSLTLYNVTLNRSSGLTVTSGDTLIVANTLTLTNGNIFTGTVEARGDVIHGAGFDGGTGTARLNITQGSTDINLTGGGQLPGTTLSADRIINGPSSGTVQFDGPLTISNGDFVGGAGDIDINTAATAALTLSSPGSFTAPSGTLYLGGGWSHTDSSTFTHNSGTVVFDLGSGYAVDVNSSETFYNLMFSTGRTVGTGDTLVTVGTLTLSNGTVNTGTLEAQGNVVVASTYDSGNTTLSFSGAATQSFDLTGATGLYDGDITVNKSGGQVNLASDLVMNASGQDLTLQEGKLSLGGYNLTVNGASGTLVVEDGGNFQWRGSETLTLNASNPTLSSGSTVTFTGNGDAASTTYTVTSLTSTYHHLVINSTDAATDTFQLGSALDVNGDLTVTAGTFDATTSNYAINIAGNWSNSGTVNMRSNTVTLDGADQTLAGSTTFYVLSKSVSTAATLTLPASTTQTITGELILTGASGQVLSLRSSSSGTKAVLDPQGSRTVEYLNVQDNENISASNISCLTGCVNAGNNVRWTFTQGGGVVYNTGPGFIPSITYTGPQDGVVLGANTEQELTWDADAFDGSYVTVEISYDGGVTYEPLYTNIVNDGIEPWMVPNVSSDEVIIKIALTDLVVESAIDLSTPFSIEIAEDGVEMPEETPSTPIELVSEVEPGMYIRGVSFPDVYYIDTDNRRRPFFNESIYFTYQDSWEPVVTVADELLSRYTIGKPMLPNPGIVLVKFESSPKVYWIDDVADSTELRWVQTEAIATDMFGLDWADYVLDVTPTFWTKFSLGEDINKPFSIDLLLMKKRFELHE